MDKRLDSKALGRLAVSVRGLREEKAALEARLATVTNTLAEKQAQFHAAMGENIQA